MDSNLRDTDFDPRTDHFFQRPRVPGAGKPSQNIFHQNLTNEPHSVLVRTFQRAIARRKRIIFREDSFMILYISGYRNINPPPCFQNDAKQGGA